MRRMPRNVRATYRALIDLRRELERLTRTRPLTDPAVVAASVRLDQFALRVMAAEERRREGLWLEGR